MCSTQNLQQNQTLLFCNVGVVQEAMSAQRAREAKELITDLGPAFVKIVQAEAQLKSKCTNLCNILLYCTHRRSHKNQGLMVFMQYI